MLKVPVTEMYAPMGARLNPNPRIKWQSDVILFVILSPSIISRATGERKRVSLLMNAVVITNKAELIITKAAAALSPIIPAGISLFFVLGFSESNLLSAILLNPI